MNIEPQESDNRMKICKYCEFLNIDMPIDEIDESKNSREVTEVRYVAKDGELFYWGHSVRIPMNYCPCCGKEIFEPQESEDKE